MEWAEAEVEVEEYSIVNPCSSHRVSTLIGAAFGGHLVLFILSHFEQYEKDNLTIASQIGRSQQPVDLRLLDH